MKKRYRGKLTETLMGLASLPLLIFGLIVLPLTSGVIYTSTRAEVRNSLEILVHSSYQIFELTFPGDYTAKDGRISKGDKDITGLYVLVDEIKEETGADATLFYGSTRCLTTIRKDDGSRAVGTSAGEEVVERVLENGREYFSDRVLVNGVPYFGYYMPVQDRAGATVGMLFVGKPRLEIVHQISRYILFLCLAAAAVMAVTMTVSVFYGKRIIYFLHKTETFLKEIAKGNLTAEIDGELIKRQDEIGEMGRFAVLLQSSITGLVGKDPLTGLYNRRSCDEVLESLAENRKASPYTVVIGDIDHFKMVNDSYGHQAGDDVLKQVARYIAGHMEHLGFVFRWGGEEFLMVYEDTGREDAAALLQDLRQEIAREGVTVKGQKIPLTLTFGIADSTEEQDPQKLLQLADDHLYVGKGRGRNQIVSSGGSH